MSPLKMTTWEAVPEHAVYTISIIKNRSHQAIFCHILLKPSSGQFLAGFIAAMVTNKVKKTIK